MNRVKQRFLISVTTVCAVLIVGHVYNVTRSLDFNAIFLEARNAFLRRGIDVSYFRQEIILNYSQDRKKTLLQSVGHSVNQEVQVIQVTKLEANYDRRNFTIVQGKRNTVRSRNTARNSSFETLTNCSRSFTGVEDILCTRRPDFLPDFRNPCWYQNGLLRCLPYFHIIGVCKTGTSDLFRRITHHPEILSNRGILGKETWYWTWRRYGHVGFGLTKVPKMTFDNFIDTFDASTIGDRFVEDKNGRRYHPVITGHGDPMDFWDQTSWRKIPQNDVRKMGPDVTTAALVKHVNPGIKLILMLRDPVERLYSNYLHAGFGKTSEQFHDDVITSLAIIQSCAEKLSLRACFYSQDLMKHLKVPLSGSFYSLHLKEWLKVFPREHFLIMRTEDFSANVTEGLRMVFDFLGVAPMSSDDLDQIAKLPTFYKTKAKMTAGSIKPETRTILERTFKPYNQDLAKLLHDEKYMWSSSPHSS